MAAVSLPEPQDDTDRWLLEQIAHPWRTSGKAA
jgi:hypothetical protein